MNKQNRDRSAGSQGVAVEKPHEIGSRRELDSDLGEERGFAESMNEGEGSRTAARRYNKATEQYVRSGKVPVKAREAEEALDGREGEELREAEERGKQGPENPHRSSQF